MSPDPRQYANIAKQYLEGALTLDHAQPDKGRILVLPTLSLAAHGLEMMLKACLYLNDKPPPRGSKGHDISIFWHDVVCEPLRGAVFVNAHLVAAEFRANKVYPDVPEDDDILPIIEEYVISLGQLHSRIGGYALRYPSEPSRKFPRTPFLVNTLWRTADDLVKRLSELKLAHFHGKI